MGRIPRSTSLFKCEGGEAHRGINMYYVYIVRSQKNGRLYNGFTSNLKKRLHEHNSGQSFATKPYLPWQLVFYAAFETEQIAARFEKYLKTGSGSAFARKRFLKAPVSEHEGDVGGRQGHSS